MSTTKSAAILTIKDAASMTPEGRQEIAAWLRREARMLVMHGRWYDKVARARYLYTEEEAPSKR